MKHVILKNLLYKTVFIIICLGVYTNNADGDIAPLTDAFQNAWQTIKGVANFGTGIGETFSGKCLQADCYYSFMFWNDSPGPMRAAEEDVKKVLGIEFDGDISESQVVQPYEHAGGVQGGNFYHSGLYLKVALQIDLNNEDLYQTYNAQKKPSGSTKWGTIYRKNIAYPDAKNVYYYRSYTDKTSIKAEYLGIKTTTNEFNGVFTNSSQQEAHLKFMKNGKEYEVTLEPGSFSLLSSDSQVKNSIRPDKTSSEKRFLTFTQNGKTFASLPLTPEGICGMQPDPAKKGAFLPSDPMLYTYEVFESPNGLNIGLQGLAIGHYNQTLGSDPKKNVVRDINPLECHLWYQSAEDYKKKMDPKDTDEPFVNPDEQMWVSYLTKDSVFQKKIKSGEVIDFTLIRPQLSEKKASLFVVSIITNDDIKAKAFLKRLNDGIIGKDAIEPVIAVPTFDASTVLTSIAANEKGIIDDTKGEGNSGVQGFVLLVDFFNPRGLGAGPYYYTISPALLRIDQLSSLFGSLLDEKKVTGNIQEFSTNLYSKIVTWIKTYKTNQTSVTQEIKEFIQQYGADSFFDANKKLNGIGQQAFDLIINGPVSIEHYPIIRQAGTNDYVLFAGTKPTDWPSK